MLYQNLMDTGKSNFPESVCKRLSIDNNGSVTLSFSGVDTERLLTVSLHGTITAVEHSLGKPFHQIALKWKHGDKKGYLQSNRCELTILQETHCLNALLYAEDLHKRFEVMSITTGQPFQTHRGLQFTSLCALAEQVAHRRYALHSVTIEAESRIELSLNSEQPVLLRLFSDGKLQQSGEKDQWTTRHPDEKESRYIRYFLNENREWLKAFSLSRNLQQAEKPKLK